MVRMNDASTSLTRPDTDPRPPSRPDSAPWSAEISAVLRDIESVMELFVWSTRVDSSVTVWASDEAAARASEASGAPVMS